MTTIEQSAVRPRVRIVGQFDHPDFAEVVELLRNAAELVVVPEVEPELIVVAQSRPDAISTEAIDSLRRDVPAANLVALLGTWCEGETRTGRPWRGIERLYWYEFPAWWRRNLALRAAGHLTDWIRAGEPRTLVPAGGNHLRGLIVVHSPVQETAQALTELLTHCGYATLWQQPGRRQAVVRGMLAGIWDGAQLSEREQNSLADFCREMARSTAAVLALLDFPRRDQVRAARQLGAHAVLGKPWQNAELTAMVDWVASSRRVDTNEASTCRAA